MKIDNWRDRISRRSDISMGIVHLTKGNDELSSIQVLIKILKEQKLIGSTNQVINGAQCGFICGNHPVVCFQDVPLHSLSENILFEQHIREDDPNSPKRYTPFGLRFDKRYIFQKGGRPVIYEKTDVAKSFLPEEEYWRIVRLDLDNGNNIIDWIHEREWRIKGDLEFELGQVEVLLSNEKAFKKFFEFCEEEKMLYLLKEIKSIIPLKSMLF